MSFHTGVHSLPCVYTVYNERTRTEVRDETTDGGTGEVTTVLGSDEDVEGSL